jgi:hypothetical protein
VDADPQRKVVLLIVDQVVEDDAWERRRVHRDWQALIPVPAIPTVGDLQALRTAIGFGADQLDWETARYQRVCIVAFPSSPTRHWVTAFFAAEMPWLVDHDGLSLCIPPFDPRHMTPIAAAEVEGLAAEWDRLQPAPPAASSSKPKRHPWSDRSGSGGWWSGPDVAIRQSDPDVHHLRIDEGRRSFCGRRAKDLDTVDGPMRWNEVPPGRRCPTCFRLWFGDIRPQREDERRRLADRLEAVTGLLRAFDELDAINRTIAEAADWPAAHSALTAAPFGYTDLQAFSILTLPGGRQTREGRADLEAEHLAVQAGLSDLDAFLATSFDSG